jgi:nucleotide-binding universal stress UspA family protein
MTETQAGSASDADAKPDETGGERIFLVVVDDSEEMPVALKFASRRAKQTGGRVALFYVAEPADFQHWASVGDLMREEAREEGERLLQKLASEVLEWSGGYPVLYLREGDIREELITLVEAEPSISILVLAASVGGGGPGPIISYFLGKKARQNRLPITIVPGNLSDEQIIQIT